MLRAVSRRLFGTVYVESGITRVVWYRGTSSAHPYADIVDFVIGDLYFPEDFYRADITIGRKR